MVRRILKQELPTINVIMWSRTNTTTNPVIVVNFIRMAKLVGGLMQQSQSWTLSTNFFSLRSQSSMQKETTPGLFHQLRACHEQRIKVNSCYKKKIDGLSPLHSPFDAFHGLCINRGVVEAENSKTHLGLVE